MNESKQPRGFTIVRKALGFSQEKFAAILGIKTDHVQNIEQRRGKVDKLLAQKIGAFTGADPWTLEGADPRDFLDKPYSEDSFKRWNEREYEEEEIKLLTTKAKQSLDTLLEAALAKGGRNRSAAAFKVILIEFEWFVRAQLKAHGLLDAAERVLKERSGKIEPAKETTFAEVSELFGGSVSFQKLGKARNWLPETPVLLRCTHEPVIEPIWVHGPDLQDKPTALDLMIWDFYEVEIEGNCFSVLLDSNGEDLREVVSLPYPNIDTTFAAPGNGAIPK